MEVPLLVDDFLRRPAQLYPDKTAIVDLERAEAEEAKQRVVKAKDPQNTARA